MLLVLSLFFHWPGLTIPAFPLQAARQHTWANSSARASRFPTVFASPLRLTRLSAILLSLRSCWRNSPRSGAMRERARPNWRRHCAPSSQKRLCRSLSSRLSAKRTRRLPRNNRSRLPCALRLPLKICRPRASPGSKRPSSISWGSRPSSRRYVSVGHRCGLIAR